MLLEKTKFNEGDVLTMKLISGEEVIGKLVSETEEYFTLDRPLMLAIGQKGVAMAPVLMTVNIDSTLKFSKNAVIVMAKSDGEIAKQYVYQTTGIQPVSAGSIIT